MKNRWLLLGLVIILNACQVQKRKYRDGFYVNWLHKKNSTTNVATREVTAKTPVLTQTETGHNPNIYIENVDASASNDIRPVRTKRATFGATPNDSCDLIIFRDGSEIRAKVREINSSDIKYKRCEMPDGPDYLVAKSTVFMIKFSNGTREVMPAPAQQNAYNQPSSTGPRKGKKILNDNALFSFIMGIIGLINPFGLGIIAIVLGNKAIEQIEKNPERYSGLNLAYIGRSLGYIKLGLVITVLVLVILSALLM